MKKFEYDKKALLLAKNLRQNMTDAEQKLWYYLRGKRFFGYKFKRQVLIGNYIADFVCYDAKIIVEIDGGGHNTYNKIKADNIRTQYLEGLGFKVIRFWNNEIQSNLDGVCELLLKELKSRS